jgi:hypothetical protein
MRRLGPDLLFIALVFCLITYAFRSFLFPLALLPARGDLGLPYRAGDLTSQFAIWIQVAIEAVWRTGVWPFWNPMTHAGTPLLAIPQAGAMSLSTLLGGIFSPAAAIKLSMLTHLWLGAGGIYWLVRGNGGGPVFAALGAICLALNPFLLGHSWIGHTNMLYPICLAPWTLGCLIRSVTSTSTRSAVRFAIAAGITAAIQVWEGGDSVPIYEALSALVIAAAWPSRGTLVSGAVAALTAFGLSAPQLLTMYSYLKLTSRGGGLAWDRAYDRTSEVDLSSPGHWVIAFAVLGALFLLRDEKVRRHGAVWLAIAVLSAVVAGPHPWAFHFLWNYFPTFSFQRLPERALGLLTVAVPILLAFGMQGLWDLARKPALRVCAIALMAAPLIQTWKEMPPPIPLKSTAEEIAANPAIRWTRQAVGSGERIHFWEVDSRDWGVDHVTQPAGLEIISGDTPSEHADYFPFFVLPASHRTFFGESYKEPAKFWGMLGVKFAISGVERHDAGFRLAARVPPCPPGICQPKSSNGTWIYENLRALPRVYRVSQAIGVKGEPRQAFEASLDLMERPDFDPARTAVIHTEEYVPLDKDAELSQRIGTYRRENVNTFRVDLPGRGWWLISERVGLFPGWKATDLEDGTELPIYRTDGVLGAVHVMKPSALRITYVPPGFKTGCWLFGITLLCLVAYVGLERSKRAMI